MTLVSSTVGKKKWSSSHCQQKSLKCSTWVQSQKWQHDLSLFPRQTTEHHGNPSLCHNHCCWRSRSQMVLWRPTRRFRANTEKDVLFIIGDWNAKVGSQEIPGVTGKFGLGIQKEAGQRLIEFCQENTLVIANTLFQQRKRRLLMDITRWPTLKGDWLYSLQPKIEKLYRISKNKTGSWLWLRSWTPYCTIQA